MIELSEKICQISGILGDSILDRNDDIIAITCLSEMAQQILEGMASATCKTLSACDVHEPELQSLSVKSKAFTILARRYSPWTVCAICQNEQILYLLESSIDALVAEYLQSSENGSQQPGQVWLRTKKKPEGDDAPGQFSPLCEEILRLARPYFMLPQTAERLIFRQIREHLKIRPEDLNHIHLNELANWVAGSARLLLDDNSARELGSKIRAMS
jgi:hypothetical protein